MKIMHCPSWCTDGDTCDGDHHGKVWGTVRRLAAALLNAANRLDEVTGSADR